MKEAPIVAAKIQAAMEAGQREKNENFRKRTPCLIMPGFQRSNKGEGAGSISRPREMPAKRIATVHCLKF